MTIIQQRIGIGATRGVLGGASAPTDFDLAPRVQNHQQLKNLMKKAGKCMSLCCTVVTSG